MSESLLQRVARGDEGAVRAVLDAYGGLVWTLASRALARAEAEDAAQEIFIDLWKSAGRFDPGVASEVTFVAMIARRRIIDRRRKLGREPAATPVSESMDGSGSSHSPSEMLERAEDVRRALGAIAQLRPEQQRVLRLSLQQGLSHERIAEATGLPLGTVKTHARRGLMTVRETLYGETSTTARYPA
ncbi:MAG: sigma-70 family RNA polymerase sigma factor [Phycisphaerales bacterium]|nr:sigma-70 family RNA polymerase sigma factor [Phycisphaerales bacterium]